MELEVFDIIVFVTGIIAGFVGALIFRAMSKKSSNDKHSSGAAIEAMQHEMERRQVLADDHFLQLYAHLAAAEKKLADARKAVLDGAATLATVELEKPEVNSANGTDSEETTAPPRDYAAKSGNDEGTLSENYGLHRKAAEEPSRAAY
ncbi:hypothetical protein MAQ5080_00787 [Marinomonas aquimarina]|uniref:Inner membrane protein YhcB n=1 Tax=Marinomonas aquimarina TaxID=295068 RepID=A0A1A8T7W2_9GAMM|nr:hypothetical protein [Marinomonas aquimarina]SBS27325.1 hypothetical protein MAQ5080_00787 [Marinomonas aquimarina]